MKVRRISREVRRTFVFIARPAPRVETRGNHGPKSAFADSRAGIRAKHRPGRSRRAAGGL